jgi:hypothetical protein
VELVFTEGSRNSIGAKRNFKGFEFFRAFIYNDLLLKLQLDRLGRMVVVDWFAKTQLAGGHLRYQPGLTVPASLLAAHPVLAVLDGLRADEREVVVDHFGCAPLSLYELVVHIFGGVLKSRQLAHYLWALVTWKTMDCHLVGVRTESVFR